MSKVTDAMVEAARLEIAPYRCPAVVRGLCAKGGDCQCRTIARRALEASLAVPPKNEAAERLAAWNAAELSAWPELEWNKVTDGMLDYFGYLRWTKTSCRRCGYEKKDCSCPGGFSAPAPKDDPPDEENGFPAMRVR